MWSAEHSAWHLIDAYCTELNNLMTKPAECEIMLFSPARKGNGSSWGAVWGQVCVIPGAEFFAQTQSEGHRFQRPWHTPGQTHLAWASSCGSQDRVWLCAQSLGRLWGAAAGSGPASQVIGELSQPSLLDLGISGVLCPEFPPSLIHYFLLLWPPGLGDGELVRGSDRYGAPYFVSSNEPGNLHAFFHPQSDSRRGSCYRPTSPGEDAHREASGAVMGLGYRWSMY